MEIKAFFTFDIAKCITQITYYNSIIYRLFFGGERKKIKFIYVFF